MAGVTRCGSCSGTLEPEEHHEVGCIHLDIAQMRKALKFYAEHNNDGGDRARHSLALYGRVVPCICGEYHWRNR